MIFDSPYGSTYLPRRDVGRVGARSSPKPRRVRSVRWLSVDAVGSSEPTGGSLHALGGHMRTPWDRLGV